jgi:hypothetical protein
MVDTFVGVSKIVADWSVLSGRCRVQGNAGYVRFGSHAQTYAVNNRDPVFVKFQLCTASARRVDRPRRRRDAFTIERRAKSCQYSHATGSTSCIPTGTACIDGGADPA